MSNLKDVYEKLEKVEGGQELINIIKQETAKLNNEAKEQRVANEEATKKVKNLVNALGLDTDGNLDEQVITIKNNLDSFSSLKKTPDEVAKEMAKLKKDVAKANSQLEAMTKEKEAEREKRISTLKESVLLEALGKSNCIAPKEIGKLIIGNLVYNEDETLSYNLGEDSVSVQDGVKNWLENNSWAVKANTVNGGGSKGSKEPDTYDAFLAGFNDI